MKHLILPKENPNSFGSRPSHWKTTEIQQESLKQQKRKEKKV
jgi:hypothetical protein